MKPHTPYVAPKKYWDLYDPEQLPLARNPDAPVGMPPLALIPQHDHGPYLGVEMEGPVDEKLARHLTHGYAACVTYMDALLGHVIYALDEEGLTDNTIVAFWGDNGYHLGENSRWGKQTCFETATRCPLIIAAPNNRAGGTVCRRPVELLSLYPTLCELAGLRVPGHVQGRSLAPLLDDSSREWDGVAVSQFPRPARRSRPEVKPEPDDCMGYSIRTARYRLTVWRHVLSPHDEVGVELYDYESDPLETANLALRPDYGPVVADLRRRLDEYGARAPA
jgi:iduronate 2-sulfatase